MTGLLNDLPTLDDKLGWECELGRLAKRIETCPMPHVLGVHGDWGSGKTSFMRLLQYRLGGQIEKGAVASPKGLKANKPSDHVVTVWFDAWRYQHESTPVVSLLQEMRLQFSRMEQVRAKFRKLSTVTLQYTLEGLTNIGKVIGVEAVPSAERIQKIGEAWEAAHYAQPGHVDSIRQHLHETIAALLPKGESTRVVVFVDDLDRCNPKAAFKLLEGLKIYLNLSNCVFVLGMNEHALVEAISEEVAPSADRTSAKARLQAAHYLEKICTDIYRLLPPASAAYFSALIGQSGISPQVAAFNQMAGEIRCLPPNLRRLKALANQWQRFAGCIAPPQGREVLDNQLWAARVIIAAYVHQFHRDIWERWHFNPDLWNECVSWCKGEYAAAATPAWAEGLKLTSRAQVGDDATRPAWAAQFPNPGEIELFWIDALVREYGHLLNARDFAPLLAGQQHPGVK